MRRLPLVIAIALSLSIVAGADVDAASSSSAARIAQRRALRQAQILRRRSTAGIAGILRSAARLHNTRRTGRTQPQTVAPRSPTTPEPVRPSAPPASLSSLQQEVLELLNKERATASLAPLRSNALLQQSAQAYATDIRTRGFFGHVSPEGQTSLDRIRATGYLDPPCTQCTWRHNTGENLASGQETPAVVVAAWMNSPGHRENILKSAFEEIGIGIDGTVWVTHFGAVSINP